MRFTQQSALAMVVLATTVLAAPIEVEARSVGSLSTADVQNLQPESVKRPNVADEMNAEIERLINRNPRDDLNAEVLGQLTSRSHADNSNYIEARSPKFFGSKTKKPKPASGSTSIPKKQSLGSKLWNKVTGGSGSTTSTKGTKNGKGKGNGKGTKNGGNSRVNEEDPVDQDPVDQDLYQDPVSQDDPVGQDDPVDRDQVDQDDPVDQDPESNEYDEEEEE